MNGSIQAKKGHYYAVLSYMAQDGKYRYKWISTGLPLRGNKKKAEAMLPDLIKEYSYLELDNTKATDPLFAEYIRDWLQDKKGQVQQSTWEGYESYINLHMIPYFEALNLTVKQVTPQHIKDYYDSRLTCSYAPHKTGLSARSIKKHAPILNQVFEQAIIAGLITNNPAAVVPLPKQEKEEPKGKFMTAEEANQMLEAFRGHELQPLVYITLYYGLRRSEVLGLKWEDVSFEYNRIHICRNILYTKERGVYEDTPKTENSTRYISIPADIMAELRHHRAWQASERLRLGTYYENQGFVFAQDNGKPLHPCSVTSWLRKFSDRHGLPHLNPHGFRHTMASMLIYNGVDPVTVSHRLGHDQVSTTTDIYSHMISDADSRSADIIADALSFKKA